MSSKNRKPILTFDDLPPEIHGIIFNYIPQDEALTLRLVSKAWDRTVNDCYLYRIKDMDENSEHFKEQITKKISHLTISRLQATSILKNDENLILDYPSLITNLTLGKYRSVTCLSPSNIKILLEHLAATLKLLNIDWAPEPTTPAFEQTLAFNFKALKRLEIAYRNSPGDERNEPGLLCALGASSYPMLKSLDFGLSPSVGPIDAQMSDMRILQEFGASLEHVSLQSVQCLAWLTPAPSYNRPAFNWQSSDVTGLQSTTNLKSFNGSGWAVHPGEGRLSLRWMGLAGYMIQTNATTLTRIKVNVERSQTPFDLSMFAVCSNLQDLTMTGDVNAINFHYLPPTITRLVMRRIKIQTPEMLAAFGTQDSGETVNDNEDRLETKGFPNLKLLHLFGSGNDGAFGITSQLLQVLFRSASLQDIKVFERDSSARSLLKVHQKTTRLKTLPVQNFRTL